MRIAVSFALFVYLVVQPLRANLIAFYAIKSNIAPASQTTLLELAHRLDSCNVPILDKLGDKWAETKNYIMAANAYGRILPCSPGNALARFKFGQAVLLMGFYGGTYAVKEATLLEPNNPIYAAELKRLMALQPQSQ